MKVIFGGETAVSARERPFYVILAKEHNGEYFHNKRDIMGQVEMGTRGSFMDRGYLITRKEYCLYCDNFSFP